MRIADYIEASNAAATPEEAFTLFLGALATLGFDRVMYSALANAREVSAPAILANYPDDWIDHYTRNGYVHSDPVRRTCVAARRPFAWSEIANSPKFTAKHLRIFPEAEAAGLYDGVAVPLHGPYGEVMGVGLASSAGGVEPLCHLHKINIIAVQFHTVASALRSQPLEPVVVNLTDREREVLRWCLAGKSNPVIAEILNVSEKTIEFHLGNAFAKLDVSSRVAAVVKALNLGLIAP